MKKNYRFLIIFIVIAFITAFKAGKEKVPIEEVDMAIGTGVDLENNNEYSLPICVYLFRANSIESDVKVGKSLSIGDTRENRQLKNDKPFVLGGERVHIYSEDFCRSGVRNDMDILFNNPQVVGTPYCLVCKGKSEDIFKTKVKGYDSPVDFIEGLAKNLINNIFFEDNYKLIDMFVRIDSEGRNLYLPYIEIIDDRIQVTGAALFKSDKMVAKINVDEAKWMNILLQGDSRGILTIQNTPKKYVNMEAHAKTKTKCLKEEGKYKFIINVDITADRIADEIYKDTALFSKPDTQKKLEGDLSSLVEKNCYDFIKKMQNDYKVDCLELGRVAAAKYGRDTGQDWNDVVSKSDIKVNVKVHLDKLGRGGY